jgi:peptidoglycan hydrolase-like protein with peptidoglycan-binding domain
MKKFIVSTAVAALLLGGAQVFAQTATVTSTSSAQVSAYLAQLQILRQLRQGMSGDDVKALQTILASQPDVYPQGLVTGFYGPMTAKAVAKYQEKFGLEPVGSVGPKTRQKLNEILSFNATSTKARGNSERGNEDRNDKDCVKIPPGHMVAPGWAKTHGGTTTMQVPSCQTLPKGIVGIIDGDHGRRGTTTVPTTTPPVLDTSAPVISGLSISGTTGYSTLLSWITNENATTKVIYGTTTPVVSSASSTVIVQGGLSLAHIVPISNLSTSTLYRVVVVSADAAGNTATSSEISFTTLP